jgi:hypothetical protein
MGHTAAKARSALRLERGLFCVSASCQRGAQLLSRYPVLLKISVITKTKARHAACEHLGRDVGAPPKVRGDECSAMDWEEADRSLVARSARCPASARTRGGGAILRA